MSELTELGWITGHNYITWPHMKSFCSQVNFENESIVYFIPCWSSSNYTRCGVGRGFVAVYNKYFEKGMDGGLAN